MADQRIAELTDGGNPQDVDDLPIERAGNPTTPGTSFKLTWASIRAWLDARFAAIAHVTDNTNPHSVTAAQANAEPAGSIATHDASGAAHGGVEGDFAAHKGAGGAEHPAATGAVAGFMSAADKTAHDAHIASTSNPHSVTAAQANAVPAVGTADGDLVPYDGAAYYKLPVGSNGSVLTARPAGAAQAKVVWEAPGGGGHTIQDEGVPLAQRANLNFVGAGVIASDDSGNDATVVTISGGGAGGGYDTVQDDGSPVTQRTILNFGADIDAADNAGATRTDVTLGANVPRIDAANIFTEDQAVQHAGTTQINIVSTDNAATFELMPGNGSANARRFGHVATGGSFFVFPLSDIGDPQIGQELAMSHAGALSLGAPTGGVPGTKGHANFEGLFVNNVATATTAGTTDGAVQVGDGAANGIKNAAFGENDVARLDINNVLLAANQRIENSNPIVIDLYQTGVAPQAGRWDMRSANGAFTIRALNDAGAQVEANPEFSIGHANFAGGQGVILGGNVFRGYGTLNATNLFIATNQVLDANTSRTLGEAGWPATHTLLVGSNISPTMAGNGFYRSNLGGPLTITTDGDSADGCWHLLLPDTVTGRTVTPALDMEVGGAQSGVEQIFTLIRINGRTTGYWSP